MDDVNTEGIHIGRALAAHRELLGISARQLAQAAASLTVLDVGWTEKALDPTEARIRRYHNGLIAAYEAAGSRANVPFGRREQWWDTRHDQYLWQGVLQERRGVHWWWAPRQVDGPMGAYCYACTTMIHTYDIKSGATHPMRVAVMRHRNQHFTTAAWRTGHRDEKRTG